MKVTLHRRSEAGGKDLFVIGHFPFLIFHLFPGPAS
jgi:hypothetical protein